MLYFHQLSYDIIRKPWSSGVFVRYDVSIGLRANKKCCLLHCWFISTKFLMLIFQLYDFLSNGFYALANIWKCWVPRIVFRYYSATQQRFVIWVLTYSPIITFSVETLTVFPISSSSNAHDFYLRDGIVITEPGTCSPNSLTVRRAL